MDKAQYGFKRVELQGWRQFESIDIELHPRLTVITGANGAGKSSILRIFSRHFGFDKPFLATPVFVNGAFVYKPGTFVSLFKRLGDVFSRDNMESVGRLTYRDGRMTSLLISAGGATQSLQAPSQQAIEGIHVDSHQSVSVYQPVGNIPASMITPEHAYTTYFNEVHQRYHGGTGGYSPLYRMKEALIAMVVFGEKTTRSSGNPALLSAFNGFVNVLRKVMPPSLGFIDLAIRSPEVVVQTKSGEFLIDSASGGVATLIDVAWRLHMFSLNRESFVVTMDEPENHLHPSMQRGLMPRLIEAFPQAQFIVATHSPFVVSSVKDSSVYVLKYNDAQGREMDGFVPETTSSRVVSEYLDTINKSSSANQILREVLGVEATVPEWVTKDVHDIVEKYVSTSISVESLGALRAELENSGYGDQYPVALAALVGNK